MLGIIQAVIFCLQRCWVMFLKGWIIYTETIRTIQENSLNYFNELILEFILFDTACGTWGISYLWNIKKPLAFSSSIVTSCVHTFPEGKCQNLVKWLKMMSKSESTWSPSQRESVSFTLTFRQSELQYIPWGKKWQFLDWWGVGDVEITVASSGQ